MSAPFRLRSRISEPMVDNLSTYRAKRDFKKTADQAVKSK